MYAVATLGLASTMDALGLSAEASALEAGLGPYWEPTPDELAESQEQEALQVGRLRQEL
jgi:hypothetical protein